jgi:hypothetical protein
MNFDTDLLRDLTPIVASLAAITAWVAKIRWADEYRTLSDKRIDTIEKGTSEKIAVAERELAEVQKQLEYWRQQAHSLIELSPTKIAEQFHALRALDQERISELIALLESKEEELKSKQAQLEELRRTSSVDHARQHELEEVLKLTQGQVNYLHEQLSKLAERDEKVASILEVIYRPEFQMEAVQAYVSHLDSEKRWLTSAARKNFERAKSDGYARTKYAREEYASRKERAEQEERARNHMHAAISDVDQT